MHVTTKGQVTIPHKIREKYNITADSEVDFIDENGKIILIKSNNSSNRKNTFNMVRGIATVKMTTDDIMALTRNNG
jgi:AbrB family looped-hinge helix DNA binding protein